MQVHLSLSVYSHPDRMSSVSPTRQHLNTDDRTEIQHYSPVTDKRPEVHHYSPSWAANDKPEVQHYSPSWAPPSVSTDDIPRQDSADSKQFLTPRAKAAAGPPNRIHVILEPNRAVVASQEIAQQLDAMDGKMDGLYLGKPIVVAPIMTVDPAASPPSARVVTVGAVCNPDAPPTPVATGQVMCPGARDGDPVCQQCGKHHTVSGAACAPVAGSDKTLETLELVGLAPSIRAIDPQVGAYFVPLAQCQDSVGCTDAQKGRRDVSICLLYQNGTCRAEQHCRQVHADRRFVTHMRDLSHANNNCCVHHGDVYSHLSEFNTLLSKYQVAGRGFRNLSIWVWCFGAWRTATGRRCFQAGE